LSNPANERTNADENITRLAAVINLYTNFYDNGSPNNDNDNDNNSTTNAHARAISQ